MPTIAYLSACLQNHQVLQPRDLVTMENSVYAQQLNAKQLFGPEVTTSPNGCYDEGVLTSRYEGFLKVYPQAAEFGFYLISTDLSAVQDLKNLGGYGSVFPIADQGAFTQILLADNNHLETKVAAMQACAYQNFYCPTIYRDLDQWLRK